MKKPQKVLILIIIDLFLFFYGISLVDYAKSNQQLNYYGKKLTSDSSLNIIAVINDMPIEKERSIKLSLKLLEAKSNNAYVQVSGQVPAYFRKSIRSKELKAGDVLLIKTRLSEIDPPKNPYEFNYKRYMFDRNRYHTCFVDSGSYALLPVSQQLNPVWLFGLTCKQVILTRLKQSNLSKNALGICSALLTGYDDEIDQSVMDAFSHSGTLHVLSVSGLHTGLIYLLLNFFFDFFDKRRRYKLSRFIFITLFLWSFALLTGFSAPVLRAVIMFNLLGLGKLYFRADTRNQLNTLLVSAFILLCYDPFLVSDVGFLLSYFAMFGLIYFQPKFSSIWQPKTKLIQYIWQSITASLAATISTLPITLFFFKQFPIWFFLANLIVVPATFVILLLAVFVVFKIGFVSYLINFISFVVIAFISLFNVKGFGFIDAIDFNFYDLLFLSLFILILSISVQYRSYRLLIISSVVLLTWQFSSIIQSYQSKSKSLLSVYCIKNKSVCSVKNKQLLLLNSSDTSDFNYHLKPQIISFNHVAIQEQEFNYIKTAKHAILILKKPTALPKTELSEIQTLVLTHNYRLTEEHIQKFQKLERIVVDASNNAYSVKKAEEFSRKFGLGFYNCKQKGAFLLDLHD